MLAVGSSPDGWLDAPFLHALPASTAKQPGALGTPNLATAPLMAMFPPHLVKLCLLTNCNQMLQA